MADSKTAPSTAEQTPDETCHELTLKLIEIVKKHKSLWNSVHEGYRNSDVKNRTWANVANELGIKNASKVKATWKNLRDRHRYAMKTRERNRNLAPWKYAKEMEFLLPYITTKQKSNVFGSLTNAEKITDTPKTDSELVERETPIEIENDAFQLQHGNDALKQFFEYMYVSTRNLPVNYQMDIKKKLFDLVLEAEGEFYRKTAENQSYVANFEGVVNIESIDDRYNDVVHIEAVDVKSEMFDDEGNVE